MKYNFSNFYKNKKVLVMGLSFKENVSDIRNSKSFDLIKYLKRKKMSVDCYDDNVDINVVKKYQKILPVKIIKKNFYDTVIILVAHKSFINLKNKIKKVVKNNGMIYDFKNIYKTNNKTIFLNEKNL